METNDPNQRKRGGGRKLVNLLRWLALFLEYILYRIDQFIDENGLRRVIDELKSREWVLRYLFRVFLIFYYISW